MFEDEGFTQVQEQGEVPPFEVGIGGSIGGEGHIDGTALRVATIVVVFIGFLILFHVANFRWHIVI